MLLFTTIVFLFSRCQQGRRIYLRIHSLNLKCMLSLPALGDHLNVYKAPYISYSGMIRCLLICFIYMYSISILQYNTIQLSFIPRPVYRYPVLESATRESLLLQQSTFVPQHSVDVVSYFHSVRFLMHCYTRTRRTHTPRPSLDVQLSLVPCVRPCFEGWRPGRPCDNRSSLIAKWWSERDSNLGLLCYVQTQIEANTLTSRPPCHTY